MDRVGLWAVLESKPGKEKEVEAFLKSAQPLADREPETSSWYAVKIGPSKFGIFDTFADEKGQQAHLTGEIAKALFARATELFFQGTRNQQAEYIGLHSAEGDRGSGEVTQG